VFGTDLVSIVGARYILSRAGKLGDDLMPQFFTAVFAGAALLAGYNWMKRATLRQAEAAQRAQTGRQVPRDLGALVWDDASGVYRPRT
jgi:hypothetical protein